jgi:peptide chain release factor 1
MTHSAPADAVESVLAEHADLERQLSDPDLHSDAVNARRVGKRFAQLAPIAGTYRKLETARGDLEAARELAADDSSFAAEVIELEARVAEAATPGLSS